jgi:hypothetical protein
MQDSPNAQQLVEAVAQFLNAELLPTVADPRLRFRSLIAANVLGIVARELAAGPAPLRDELARVAELLGPDDARDAPGEALEAQLLARYRALCAQIRAGRFDDHDAFARALAFARASTIARLQIANPRYLARVLPEQATERGQP